MSVEFVDTNILFYAHDAAAGRKHAGAVALLSRLFSERSGALSTQILAEFYAVATKKLSMTSQEAEAVLINLQDWTIHRPDHADLLGAARLHRRHQMAWWDALVVRSAQVLGCLTLWTEDLQDGQRFGSVTVRNPFLEI